MSDIVQYRVDKPFAVQIIRGPLAGVMGQVVSIVCDSVDSVYVIATVSGKTAQRKGDCVRIKK